LPVFKMCSELFQQNAPPGRRVCPAFDVARDLLQSLLDVPHPPAPVPLSQSRCPARSMLPVTWTMSGSSKQRTMWMRASTSRMWLRNLLPRPSPWEAPFTSPAMSTNSQAVGICVLTLATLASCGSRGSGTLTTPRFGFDGAKRIVLRRSLVRARYCVEERGFPHVRKTNDASL